MKNKKLLAKLIFVIVLLAIIVYTFRDSAGPIFRQLRETSIWILIGVCISSVVYHLFESWITYSLAKRYNPAIKYRRAVGCAFYCSFYRLATLGSGSGVAAVYFLGKSGVEYSKGTGLYMVQYVMHKVSIALFSGVLFLINWRFMVQNYSDYAVYLILAYGLTVVIAVALILLAVSAKFHTIILKLLGLFNKSGKLDQVVLKLQESCKIMEVSTAELLKEKGTLLSVILKNLMKFCFWYGIPFIILYGTGTITLLQSLAVSSLSVMTAAVIPTPAGIGALELIMASLIGLVPGVDEGGGGAITLIYRFATFIFPFFVGAVYVLVTRTGKKQIMESDRMNTPDLDDDGE